jgi:hypothetical protein
MTPKGAIFIGIAPHGLRRGHRAAEAGDEQISREDVVNGRARTAG